MFDELIRELSRLDGTHRVKVSIASDVEGYLDRERPLRRVLYQFKVHEKNWRDKVRDDEVFCPLSRVPANRIGQRLVLRETAIHECLALIEKLGSAMAAVPS